MVVNAQTQYLTAAGGAGGHIFVQDSTNLAPGVYGLLSDSNSGPIEVRIEYIDYQTHDLTVSYNNQYVSMAAYTPAAGAKLFVSKQAAPSNYVPVGPGGGVTDPLNLVQGINIVNGDFASRFQAGRINLETGVDSGIDIEATTVSIWNNDGYGELYMPAREGLFQGNLDAWQFRTDFLSSIAFRIEGQNLVAQQVGGNSPGFLFTTPNDTPIEIYWDEGAGPVPRSSFTLNSPAGRIYFDCWSRNILNGQGGLEIEATQGPLELNGQVLVNNIPVGRKDLGGAVTYYVRTATGNDNNDGLTPATAWATYAKVQETIYLDFFNGYYVIDVTDCVFTEAINFLNIRGPSVLLSSYPSGGGLPNPDSYGCEFQSAINVRAEMTVIASFNPGDATLSTTSYMRERWTLSVSPGWTPDEHIGRFVRFDAAVLGHKANTYPITANGVDWIEVLATKDGPRDPMNSWWEIVEPSCEFQMGVNQAHVNFDSVDGYTFHGVEFTGDSGSLRINNVGTLALENCTFSCGRTPLGGNGAPRFVKCSFTADNNFRSLGTSAIFKACATVGPRDGYPPNSIGVLFDYASPYNDPSDVTFYGRIDMNVDGCFAAASLDSTYHNFSTRAIFSELSGAEFNGPPNFGFGTHILQNSSFSDSTLASGAYVDASFCTISGAIVVLPGATMRVVSSVISGAWTVGSTVIPDASALVLPYILESDGAKLIVYP